MARANQSGRQHQPAFKQFDAAAAVHAPLQEFEFGDLALCLAVAVGQGYGCDNSRFITLESGCKAAELRQAGGGSILQPRVEYVRLALADQLAMSVPQACRAQSEIRAFKARAWSVPPAQWVLPAQQARKA